MTPRAVARTPARLPWVPMDRLRARTTFFRTRSVPMRATQLTSSFSRVERAPMTALAGAAAAGVGIALGGRRRARRTEIRTALGTRRDRPPAPGEVRLSVVVPAFREERIGTTVTRLRKDLVEIEHDGGLEIVVVDDGSGDDTAAEAEAAGADVVVRQPFNQGKGAAVRVGMLAAQGRTRVFTDAD